MLIREKLEEAIMCLKIGDFDPSMPSDVLEPVMDAAEGEPKLLRKLVELQNRYDGGNEEDVKKLIEALENLVRDGPPALATVSESAMEVPEPTKLGKLPEDGMTEEAPRTRFWAKTPDPASPRISAPMLMPEDDTDPDTEDSQIKNPQEMAEIVRRALSQGRTQAASASPGENGVFRAGMTVKNPSTPKRGVDLFAGMVITEPPPVRKVEEALPPKKPPESKRAIPKPSSPPETPKEEKEAPPGFDASYEGPSAPPPLRPLPPRTKKALDDALADAFFKTEERPKPRQAFPPNRPRFEEEKPAVRPLWRDILPFFGALLGVFIFFQVVDALLPETTSTTEANGDDRACEALAFDDLPMLEICEVEEGWPTCELPVPPAMAAVTEELSREAETPSDSPVRAIVKKTPPKGKPLNCRNAILQGETGFVKFRGKLWHLKGVQLGKNAACILSRGEHAGDVVRTGCFDPNTTNDSWCPVATILSEG